MTKRWKRWDVKANMKMGLLIFVVVIVMAITLFYSGLSGNVLKLVEWFIAIVLGIGICYWYTNKQMKK